MRVFERVNFKKLVLSLLLIVVLSGCSIINNFEAQGLKKYFLGFIAPHNIKIKEISCQMESSSRAGYFLFQIAPEEFERLKDDLHLKEIALKDEFKGNNYPSSQILLAIKRGAVVKGFDFKNPAFDDHNPETWLESPLLPGIKVYIAEPMLPPMKGNTRSSFDFLIYNPRTYKACAFLRYPYG